LDKNQALNERGTYILVCLMSMYIKEYLNKTNKKLSTKKIIGTLLAYGKKRLLFGHDSYFLQWKTVMHRSHGIIKKLTKLM